MRPIKHQRRHTTLAAAVVGLLSIGLLAPAPPASATFPGTDLWIYWASDKTGHEEIWIGAWGVGSAQSTYDTVVNRRPAIDPLSVNDNIAFDSLRDGDTEIYYQDNGGGGQTQMTHNHAADFGAAYSPTGYRIVFTSSRTGSEELWTMNGDGSNQKRLTTDNGVDENADWSPDGTKIAFYHKGKGDPAGVYTIKPSGKGMKLISKGSNFPSWAPNGLRIAVTRVTGGYNQVFLMDSNGANIGQLTFIAQGATMPAWSPDGTEIAFSGRMSDMTDIYTIWTNGTNQFAFIGQDLSATEIDPAWTP